MNYPLLIAMLASLAAIAPLAVDMYLPAMHDMASQLAQPIEQVELSISTFLIGFAIGQLLGGSTSDRFGRKPVIFFGLLIYTISSIGLAMADSLELLLFLRFIQAIGGGAATVNSPAIVRDRFEGAQVAKTLSMVAMVMMSAPLVAPILGSLIHASLGWRAIFWILAGYALLIMLIFMVKLPESRTKQDRKVLSKPLQSYKRILSDPMLQRYLLILTFGFSTMFVFLTSASYLYLEHYQQPASMFPWLFGANIALMIVLNRVNIYFLNRYSAQQILSVGATIQWVSAILLFVSLTLFDNLWLTVIPISMMVGSLGLVSANGMSLALAHFRDISGTVASLIGVFEFAFGALFGLIWSYLHDQTPLPIAYMAILTTSLSMLVLWKVGRKPIESEN